MFVLCFKLKGIVNEISNNQPSLNVWYFRFKNVPLKALYDQFNE